MVRGYKTGGRQKGTPNKASAAKRAMAARILPDNKELDLWNKFLHVDDTRVAWEAFKLAKAYKSGQPPRAKEDREPQQIVIVNHIPRPERG